MDGTFLDQEDLEAAEHNAFFSGGEGVPDTPAEDLLKVMKGFVLDYSKSLGEVREALSANDSEAWEMENDLINLATEPTDTVDIMHMIGTENSQLNKVSLVFSVLMVEVKELMQQGEEKFFGGLTMFGHSLEGTGKEKPVPPETQMGNFLPFLTDLLHFTRRACELGRNMVNQLACLYHERQRLYITTFKQVRLECVFQSLGQLCRLLVTLDAIIADNAAIAQSWATYKHMIKYVRADPDRYGVDNPKLRSFEKLLVQLDRNVLSGKIFENFLAMDFGLPGGQNSKALVAGNRVLMDEFSSMIKTLFKRYVGGLGDAVETYGRESFVDLYGAYALFRRLFRATAKPDKKLYQQLWALQKQMPLVMLYGRAVWLIPDFLVKYCPISMQGLSPSPQKVRQNRTDFLNKLDNEFDKQTEALYLQMCMWMVRLESDLVAGKNNNLNAVLNARSKLVLNGILLANQIRNLVTTAIHLHLLLEMPFRGKNVRALALCSEMLKAIQMTYQRRVSMVGENIANMLGQTGATLKRIFQPIRKKLDKKSRLDDVKLDVLAAIQLALDLLDRPATTSRQQVINVALSVAQVKGMLKQNHADEVRYQLWKLELLASWQKSVSDKCNCDYLYWVSNLVPAFFGDIFKHPTQVNRLQYLFAAFTDSSKLLARSLATPEKFTEAYQKEVLEHFNQAIVEPLSREVETDLRLHIHSVVLKNQNLRNKENKDLGRFLDLKPLVFFGTKIDLRSRVTHYLDRNFYDLTAMTLHDWRVYAEMRNLAYEKYSLKLAEVHLPGSSHYSGALDILEIMRNIHIFVGRYNYNMNTQVFIERAYDQKHLNTINIFHIAQSIRSHGTGIMNTTVNFTYQFLVRKFQLFSEFLYDDHIKSRLMKDIRYYKAEKEALNNMYPYERADKFNKDIRKLGVNDANETFLDQFRLQITEIGNALGYVRMARSGGLHHLANGIKFVPDLEDVPSFSESATAAGLPSSTLGAATNLDNVIEDLSASFSEGTEYFSILVKVFSGVLKGDTQKHLRNFYAIGPPLMLNFVATMSALKEKVSKKASRTEASFTDDGFALGLAYILRLLDQDDEFDSLHWFESVRSYVKKKQAEIQKIKSKKNKSSSEDLQHFQLTVKRLGAMAREFELLYFSFTGARIFFKENESDSTPAAEEPAAAEPAPAAAADAPLPDTGAAAPPAPAGAPPPAPPM